MTKNKNRIPANSQPVVTIISETETVTTYPDGLTVRETQNRPNTVADIKWLVEGVSRILPYFQAGEKSTKNIAA